MDGLNVWLFEKNIYLLYCLIVIIWEVSFPFLFSHLVEVMNNDYFLFITKSSNIIGSSNFDEDLPSVFALHDFDNNSLF